MTSLWRHSRLTYYDLGADFFYTRCRIVGRRGMASFKAKFPVPQELFAKNHRGGPFGPSPPAGRGLTVVRPWYTVTSSGPAQKLNTLRELWCQPPGGGRIILLWSSKLLDRLPKFKCHLKALWRRSRLTYDDMRPIFDIMCGIIARRGMTSLVSVSVSFSEIFWIQNGGGVSSPPPSGRGMK